MSIISTIPLIIILLLQMSSCNNQGSSQQKDVERDSLDVRVDTVDTQTSTHTPTQTNPVATPQGSSNGTSNQTPTSSDHTQTQTHTQTELLDFKQLEIGYNLSYLGDAEKFIKGMDYAKQDGIVYLRVYEPFTNGLYKDMEKLMQHIDIIMLRNFKLLISLSNFPFKADVDKMQFEGEVLEREEAIEFKTNFTNRYPPDDKQAFKDYLIDFMDELKDRGYLNRIEFEIFNEPDAPKFFWGTSDQFEEYFHFIHDVLKPYGVKMYCCGFTSRMVSDPTYHQDPFVKIVKKDPLIGSTVPLTFHTYLLTQRGEMLFDDIDIPKLSGSMITEYDMYARMNEGSVEHTNSVDYLYYFAKLLDFTYQNDVKRVYIQKLMDNYQKAGKLSQIDVDGKPKVSYQMVQKVRDIIKDGYHVERTKKYIKVSGKDKYLYVALKDHSAELTSSSVTETSTGKGYDGELDEEEWVIGGR